MTGRFMTGSEVAELLRTSESTVRYWKHIGKLDGIRVGRRTLYERTHVDALIDGAAARGCASPDVDIDDDEMEAREAEALADEILAAIVRVGPLGMPLDELRRSVALATLARERAAIARGRKKP